MVLCHFIVDNKIQVHVQYTRVSYDSKGERTVCTILDGGFL